MTQRSYGVVELYAPVATDQQFRVLYKQVRQALRLTHLAALTDEDVEFLTLVEDLGEEPPRPKGRKAFWEDVKKQWNAKMGRQVYKDWNGPKRRYRRLQK